MSADVDHVFINGPFDTGPQVTEKCISCHEEQAEDMLNSVHWNWAGSTIHVPDHEGKVNIGKKNLINNFCIATISNEPRCTSCHAGYGWKDDSFDFSNKSNIDCLVCHDTTGTYKKVPTGAGMPDPSFDLVAAAQSVGSPTRCNCGGNCHFRGGGGDAIKHGDLYSGLCNTTKIGDVHMGGYDLLCQDCHVTTDHKISGLSIGSPVTEGRVSCTGSSCHDTAPHAQDTGRIINAHTDTVACQACHIPQVAQEVPTKIYWDWSTAGQDIDPIPKDEYGMPKYHKKKGSFVWGMNVVPTYAWYNGTVERYMVGDKIDPAEVNVLGRPVGALNDLNSKIYPFRIHSGKQISDADNKYLIIPHLFGKDGYWNTFDWDKAAEIGMEAAGLPYSGQYEFVDTSMYMSLNHEIAPKETALSCHDCHSENSRMDFVALGYAGDPREIGGRNSTMLKTQETGEAAATPSAEPTQKDTIPGFEFIIALVGLLGAVLIFRRSRYAK